MLDGLSRQSPRASPGSWFLQLIDGALHLATCPTQALQVAAMRERIALMDSHRLFCVHAFTRWFARRVCGRVFVALFGVTQLRVLHVSSGLRCSP